MVGMAGTVLRAVASLSPIWRAARTKLATARGTVPILLPPHNKQRAEYKDRKAFWQNYNNDPSLPSNARRTNLIGAKPCFIKPS